MDNNNPLDFENMLDEVTQFLFKGLDVNSLEKQQKNDLYGLVEFMSKLAKLKQKASKGKLNKSDLRTLEQTHQIIFKYHRLIMNVLQTNNDYCDSDEWI